jgi:hypothetical protein
VQLFELRKAGKGGEAECVRAVESHLGEPRAEEGQHGPGGLDDRLEAGRAQRAVAEVQAAQTLESRQRGHRLPGLGGAQVVAAEVQLLKRPGRVCHTAE